MIDGSAASLDVRRPASRAVPFMRRLLARVAALLLSLIHI